jgi:hypothetical protein
VRLAFLLGFAGVAGLLASPTETAKRSRADLEAGLKALEAKHRAAPETPPPKETKEAATSAEKPKAGGKAAKGAAADLVIKPDEMKRARAELLRLNGYRYLCGLDADVKLKDEYVLTCKVGAYLCSVLGHIEHTPPKPAGMDDLIFKKGYEGTSHSNLFYTSGPDGLTGSVDGYMDDSDEKNVGRVGHRRWCLNPGMGFTGFGQVRGFSAMWSFDGAGAGAGARGPVCFPAAGFWPLSFYRMRTAWSISADPGRFAFDDKAVPKVYLLGGSDRFPAEVKGLKELKLADVRVSREGIGTPQCLIFRPDVTPRRGTRVGVSVPLKGWTSPNLEYVVEFY